MIDLGALKIDINVGKDKAINELNDIGETADKQQSKFKKFGEGLKKGALIGAAGIAGLATGMVAMATKASATTDNIDKMSQKIGMSREGFQEWDFILSQNGASIDGMQAGMKTLTNQVDELSKGGKVATDAFGQLGLSYEDMAGLSQEEIFEKTIVALQGVEDTTKRAAIANDLLGKSGSELAPLLNAGADSVDAMKKQAHELGLVINDESIDAGVKFTDTIDQLKRSFGAVFTQVGTAVMPMFINFAGWITEHMPQIQAVMSVVFNTISTVVSTAYSWFETYLLPVLVNLFSWINENMPTIKKVVSTVFGAISDIVSKCWGIFSQNLIPILVALWDFISPTFPLIQKIVEVTFGAIVTAVEFVVDVFDRVTNAIKTAVEWLGSWNNTDAKNKDISTNNKTKVDGSHANGLDYVPFDGYIAELHQGERVLTAQQAQQNNTSTINVTGNSFIIREEADITKIGRELQRQITTKQRGAMA